MTLNLTKQNRIYKKLFDLKLPQRDGMVLNVHHTKNAQKIRFTHGSFNKFGNILALSDSEANIFIIDLNLRKFWNLPKMLNSCSIVKFSQLQENELLVGARSGLISVIEIQTGAVLGELSGHNSPVINVSFADFLCLTSSDSEAILWDLRNYTKVQVLNLVHNATLKYANFIPVTNDILTCFNDDVIQIWQFGVFEIKNQIPPLVWFSHEVKNITFTIDGKIMVIGCRSPYLALFLLSNYKLLKFITLPEYIQTLKHVEFIPQANDGGSNKILAILSGRGTIYFYDIEQNVIISELISTYEITSSGDANIYDISQYTVFPLKIKTVRAPIPDKSAKLKKCLEKSGIIKEQIREILEIEKLQMILKECGEYPDSYRGTIWEHLLELPNNKRQYNAIINNRMVVSFDDLCRKYPLQDKRCLKNLKQLLDNLVTWCPFFLHVDFLPLFVFPFVKMFVNRPLVCFEVVCTIIVNWCQFWFEYFPLPPVNILAMVENVLMQHDPELLSFLTSNKITSTLYAWPLLRTAFSEVLTAPSWKILWDHILTNEPSFFLCTVVAYNMLQRRSILKLKPQEFQCFYNTHHPIDVKTLLAKSYHVLANTNAAIHPRQYLSGFKKIPGEYPNFCDYPKTMIDFKAAKDKRMKDDMMNLKSDELSLFKERLVNLERLENLEVQEEQNKRVLEMENAIQEQLLQEQERLHQYYERVAKLRKQFREEDQMLDSIKNKIAKEQQRKSREKHLAAMLDDVSFEKRQRDFQMTKVEDELLFHYSELLKHKYKLEQLLPSDCSAPKDILTSTKTSYFDKHQEKLAEEIEAVSRIDNKEQYLKTLNLETGVEAMDSLIKKIEDELALEKYGVKDDSAADRRVMQLQAETQELAAEVNNLIQLLVDLRNVNG